MTINVARVLGSGSGSGSWFVGVKARLSTVESATSDRNHDDGGAVGA
jgi:hypothetical protein